MADALERQLASAQAPRLRPSDAVAAILINEDSRYIMQLRDGKSGIFYPDHWGCFGGAVEKGESPVMALRRELQEELEFEAHEVTRFTQFDFDFSPLGYSKVYRIYFEVAVTASAFRRFVLHEGAALKAFDGPALLAGEKVTPYDSFAIWMHLYRRAAPTAVFANQS
jgi:8-oxo-dGTP pyrophosphatase MutT (NUDIX family)